MKQNAHYRHLENHSGVELQDRFQTLQNSLKDWRAPLPPGEENTQDNATQIVRITFGTVFTILFSMEWMCSLIVSLHPSP